jgi:diaminopimelate decarboxylase
MRLLKKIVYLILHFLREPSRPKNNTFLLPTVWGMATTHQGRLVIGGCDCVGLSETYGTPLFVVDKARIQRNYQSFFSALAAHGIEFEIYYSYKTNPVPGILQVLHAEGAGAEVISPYELWLANHLKVEAHKIVYNGPNKSYEGLKSALESRIKLININSFHEINVITRLVRQTDARPELGIRVTTDRGWANQFGFSIRNGDALRAFEKVISLDACSVKGIHVHLGTGLQNTVIYENAILEITELMQLLKQKYGLSIRYLDLGGGYGVATVKSLSGIEVRLHHDYFRPYAPPMLDKTPSIAQFVDAVVHSLKAQCARRGLELPYLLLEPGRALTSNAEVLLSRIGDLKKVTAKYEIAFADAGINLAYPLLWEYHEIFIADKMNDPRDRRYGIAGPICTPTDLYIKSKWLPAIDIGNLLCIADAGAYFTSFSTEFSFPRPAIVMVDQGTATLIRQKATFEDLTLLDDRCKQAK